MQDSGGTSFGGVDTSVAQTFTLGVNFINDQPSFTAANPPAVNEDSAAQTVSGWVSAFEPSGALPTDGNEAGQSVLAYTVSGVSNTALFAAGGQPVVDSAGTLTYTLAPNQSGTAFFSVTVQDSGGTANGGVDTSAPQTFTLTANFVNDQPSFSASSPPAVNENTGAHTLAGWATGFNPGLGTNESGQSVAQYLVSNVSNPVLFAVQPAVSTSGTLSYTLASNVSGTVTFQVQVQDTGGTANGGTDTSAAQTFTLTINFVNQAPSFTASSPPLAIENSGSNNVPNWATYSPGAGNNSAGEALLAYHVLGVSNPALFTAAGQPAVNSNGTLSYTLAAQQVGSANITVTAQDQGGTANGGQDTSAPQVFTIQSVGLPPPLPTPQTQSYTQGSIVNNLSGPLVTSNNYTVLSAGTQAYFLYRDLGLFFTGGYSQNYGGSQEKWLQGTVHQPGFGNPWYFIKPNGQFYVWDNTTAKASGTLLASLDPLYYQNPSLLWNATAVSYAAVVQQSLGLFFTGNYFQDFNGLQDRWLQGTGGVWYYLTPDGKLYASGGTFLAALDPIYYNEPARLYNANNPGALPTQNVTVAITQGSSPTLVVTPHNQFVGNWVVELTTTLGTNTRLQQVNYSFTDSLPVFATPTVTSPMSHTASQTVSLSASDADNDPLAFSATAGDQGYVVGKLYNLHSAGSFYTNSLGVGLQEKWVKGLNNQYGNPWYFITPALQLFAWDGTGTNPITAGQQALATLDQPIYYTFPAMLYQSVPANTTYDLAAATQRYLVLRVSASGTFFNSSHLSEKWLQDSSNAWYYILPNGKFYKWGGTSNTANDTFLATFDGPTTYGSASSPSTVPLASARTIRSRFRSARQRTDGEPGHHPGEYLRR